MYHDLEDVLKVRQEERKMTYRDVLRIASKNNNCAEIALGQMMDIVEEQTGVFPDWSDKAPAWVLNNFGITDDSSRM